jgi:serine/threonine-protein kinase
LRSLITRLGRDVAIKTLRSALEYERATDRFVREARALATVNHPNVCQVVVEFLAR